MKKFIYLFTAIFLLSACGTSQHVNPDITLAEDQELFPAEATFAQNDFVYRITTEKDVYDEYGDIAIFAELTYAGDQESIDIYHAASPFSFPLEERTRGFKIDYPMDHSLIVRTLQQGVPFRERYTFAGGYSDADSEEYIAFAQTLMKDGFPEGYYIIRGSSQFSLADPSIATDEQKFNMTTNIGFSVRKGVNE